MNISQFVAAIIAVCKMSRNLGQVNALQKITSKVTSWHTRWIPPWPAQINHWGRCFRLRSRQTHQSFELGRIIHVKTRIQHHLQSHNARQTKRKDETRDVVWSIRQSSQNAYDGPKKDCPDRLTNIIVAIKNNHTLRRPHRKCSRRCSLENF